MPDLHLEIFSQAQQRVWRLLAERADPLREGGYYLAGGTALALQLGHRQSVDFDFFSQERGRVEATLAWLQEMAGFTARDIDRETIHGDLDGVKLSFLGAYRYPLLEAPIEADGIRIAGPLDIGLMKILAISHRAAARDYLDLAALVRSGCPLAALLQASTQKYGPSFDPMVCLRALTAFGDLEEGEMPIVLDETLSRSWKEILRQAVRGATEQ